MCPDIHGGICAHNLVSTGEKNTLVPGTLVHKQIFIATSEWFITKIISLKKWWTVQVLQVLLSDIPVGTDESGIFLQYSHLIFY